MIDSPFRPSSSSLMFWFFCIMKFFRELDTKKKDVNLGGTHVMYLINKALYICINI